MDCMDLQYDDNSMDFVIDKSTVDALLCGDHAFLNVATMLKECQRVLKIGGTYMAITYGEPRNRTSHFVKPHLSFEVKQFQISNPYKEKSEDKD
jgi:ubiquinone/menaquinone biosynthesis C-methylase UbiE